ncbi:HNH endonuclease [Saccharothrix obliqua]|uniref:HNH endonuclease n=1 Tax=Saccharothrix obliqua TaxID=2861747 RepID=UPI001C5FBA05|nr:HNH endonuclease [Saccharothrix obliqua]MBW4719956.1 hypothetical protein [Saccharothrix obliqua]
MDDAGLALEAWVTVIADGGRFVVEVAGRDAGAVGLVLRRLGGYSAVLHLGDQAIALDGRSEPGVAGLPSRLVVDVPDAVAGQLEVDLSGPAVRIDRRFAVGGLMAALGDLNRYRRGGPPSLHKPLALVWALGRLAAGHGRLFRWPDFRDGLGPVLADFGVGAATPEYPFWHLGHEWEVWETHGITKPPRSGDAHAVAGFTPRAAALLADPGVRAEAVDVLRATYLGDVDQPALFDRVGLAVPRPLPAADVVDGLVGREIRNATGGTLQVERADSERVVIRAEDGIEFVPMKHVRDGVDELFRQGRVVITDDRVGAIIGSLPGTRVTGSAVVLGDAGDFGELDRVASARYRVEQAALRRVLIGDEPTGRCALCGRELPVELLVAAHVKPRKDCSDEERRDLRNVAMLACHLGCDRLFELGYLGVGPDGVVVSAGALAEGRAVGRRTPAHHPGSAGYFAWHRAEVFRGTAPGGVGGGR